MKKSVSKRKTKYKVVRYPYSQRLLSEYKDRKVRQSIDHLFSKPKLVSFRLLTVFLFILTALYGWFFAKSSYIRQFQSIRDLGYSIAYYATLFIHKYEIEPTVNSIPSLSYVSFLPESWELFKAIISQFFSAVFKWNNFVSYLNFLAIYSERLLPFILPFSILIPIVKMIPEWILDSYNIKWLKRTKPLVFYDKLKDKLYFPAKRYIADYIAWHRGHYFYNFLFLLWVCNLNGGTVIIGFFAWYFYFAKSFDFVGIYKQVLKLSIDILIFFDSSFGALTLAISYYVFNRVRKNMAYVVLNSNEARNLRFVNSLPVCTLVVGEMGAGKTQAIVDIALTKAVQLRNQALERMYKYDLYFPDFPWERFEKYLQLKMKRRQIYNLSSIEDVFNSERASFERCPEPLSIYKYDIKIYPIYRTVGNKVIYIWNALETYAKLYLVYVLQNSIIMANFSIREDYLVLNCGNFILYDHNFFTHPLTKDTTHFSHILNYDILRMGKTMIEDTSIKNCLEFGVIVITEIGKERGNNLENLHIKKNDSSVNVKNDLFVFKLKMARHAGTIDNYCFVFFIFDEQRAMSLGADLREVCDQLIIKERSPMKLAMPFFFVESAIYDLLKHFHKPFHYGYKHSHGNRGLLTTVLKSIVSVFVIWVDGIYDKFGFSVLSFYHTHGNGTADDGEKILQHYYLAYGKIYNSRYSTDTHAEYSRATAREAEWCFDESPCYTCLHASEEQLRLQRSFFVNDMLVYSNRS